MRNINLRYVDETYDEAGRLTSFDVHCPRASISDTTSSTTSPWRIPIAARWYGATRKGEEHVFTFGDMKKWSDKTANFLSSCGIGRGDYVMVILRRHYQFWFVATALAKLGAVMVPATFMLKEHDLTYRINGADIKAVVTSAQDIADVVDNVAGECPSLKTRILVNPCRRGSHAA